VAASAAPIPVTVVGGYLGAGKTTLVNHLLRNANGLRLAVLVNEFGELPIDSDLIESADENLISIAGGCICCSYGSDLMATLVELPTFSRRPQHILIEASGVALPGAIASSVGLVQGCQMDGVVVLADGERVMRQGSDRYLADTIERQLSEANLVLLTKADLLDAEHLEAVRLWLETRCPGSRIVESRGGRVPLSLVLSSGLYQAPLNETVALHAHFETFSFVPRTGSDPAELAKALAAPSLGLARAKGFVTDEQGLIKVVHVVGNSWLLDRAPVGVSGSGVVCIGVREHLDREALFAVIRRYDDGFVYEESVHEH